MRTINALSSEAVLVGRLQLDRTGPSRRPTLSVSAWCPCCRRSHRIDWPANCPANLDAVVPAGLPEGCLLAGSDVLIGMDPDRANENLATIQHFTERDRAWRTEQGLAGKLAGRARIGPGPASRPIRPA